MPATINLPGRQVRSRCRTACSLQGFLKQVLECPDLRVQAALVTRCFVLVHQAFSSHGIEHRNRRSVGVRGGRLVAGVNRCNNTLNVSTHHRPHAGVTGTSCFRLTGAFFCLGGVRQVSLLEKLKIQPNSIVRAQSVVNQSGNDKRLKMAYGHAYGNNSSGLVQPGHRPARFCAYRHAGALQ